MWNIALPCRADYRSANTKHKGSIIGEKKKGKTLSAIFHDCISLQHTHSHQGKPGGWHPFGVLTQLLEFPCFCREKD